MRSGRIHGGTESGYLRSSFDPHEQSSKKWNTIHLLLNVVVAVSLDPLFFYIPVIKADKKCLALDKKLKIAAIVLRTLIDISGVINIIFQWNGVTAGKTYLYPSFLVDILLYPSLIIDFLAVLPVPQVVILVVIPNMRGPKVLHFMNLFNFCVIFQSVPRLLRIYPLYKMVKKTFCILTEAWAQAVFNLLLFMLASHVLGASWYFFSIERETTCWRKACQSQPGCIPASLYCHDSLGNNSFLNEICPIKTPNATLFDFGIFLDALQSGIVESTDFPEKLTHCFWWGLQNLSSFGQSLKTSRYLWENCFAVFITLSGLVLFISFIGNMQVYLQSETIRLEGMRLKVQDIERWTSFRLLSDDLQKQVRNHQLYKWRKTRGVDVENLLHNLPRDLSTSIKCQLCWELIKNVPWVETDNDQMIEAICDRLKFELYTEECYIVREGDPVNYMLFVMQGELRSWAGDGDCANSVPLKKGDVCGEELYAWALDPHSSPNVPRSTRNVQAVEEVEAFALAADDLKIILSQHPPPLQQRSPSSGATSYPSKSSSLPQSLPATSYASESSSLSPRSPSLGATSASNLSVFCGTGFACKFATTLRGLRLRRKTLVPLEIDSDHLLAKMV